MKHNQLKTKTKTKMYPWKKWKDETHEIGSLKFITQELNKLQMMTTRIIYEYAQGMLLYFRFT